METVVVMHAWVFRNLDQLRQIYDLEDGATTDSAHSGATGLDNGSWGTGSVRGPLKGSVRIAPGTAQRLPLDDDVAIAPMPRRPAQ